MNNVQKPVNCLQPKPKLIFPLNFRKELFPDVVILKHATRIETLQS